jgi:hypothetical protein
MSSPTGIALVIVAGLFLIAAIILFYMGNVALGATLALGVLIFGFPGGMLIHADKHKKR